LTRTEALEIVRSRVKNDRLVKHMLAAEAVMSVLAARLGEDREMWGLAGLLHDVDYDETAADPERHGIVGAALLKELGVADPILHAVESHAGHRNRATAMDRALYATDPLTGLVVAAALMHPSKKVGAINPEFVLKRFKEKRFAAGANREQIKTCEELGLPLEEFISIALAAMQGIAGDLGL